MKIAMIGQKGMPALHGGVERHVHELALRLAKRDFDVRVYSRSWYTKNQGKGNIAGVNVIHVPSINTKHLDTITHTLVATIHAMMTGAQVFHYHGIGPALLSWIPRVFRPGARVITTFHSIDRKHEKWGPFARFALRIGELAALVFAHKTVTVSEGIRTYVEVVYGKKTELIPNAVPEYTKQETTDALDAFGLKKNEYLLVVTRLIAHKGVQYLIDAYTQLANTAPEVLGNKKLVIVGDGYHSGDYVAALHAQAGKNSNIIFTGFQSGQALAELFSHAYLKVHPSDNEGLPLSVLEAMSYELPVLASDIAGHRDLVDHPAYTFAAGSVDALTKKLHTLLSASPDVLSAEGQRNKQKVRTLFSWDIVVDKTIALYEPDIAPIGRAVVA